MKTVLFKLGMWLISQKWFQFYVVKYITQMLESVKEKEVTMKNDLSNFIAEHRRSLLTIVNKEVKRVESVIDERLANALKK